MGKDWERPGKTGKDWERWEVRLDLGEAPETGLQTTRSCLAAENVDRNISELRIRPGCDPLFKTLESEMREWVCPKNCERQTHGFTMFGISR